MPSVRRTPPRTDATEPARRAGRHLRPGPTNTPCRPRPPRPLERRWRGSREPPGPPRWPRSEEHTSELQSQSNLVCRLLLEKKKRQQTTPAPRTKIATTAGTILDAEVLGEGLGDVQVRTDDGRVHLLRPAGGSVRAATPCTD